MQRSSVKPTLHTTSHWYLWYIYTNKTQDYYHQSRFCYLYRIRALISTKPLTGQGGRQQQCSPPPLIAEVKRTRPRGRHWRESGCGRGAPSPRLAPGSGHPSPASNQTKWRRFVSSRRALKGAAAPLLWRTVETTIARRWKGGWR